MATASTVTTDLTTCPICFEQFDNPKSLPCLHAFCLKCLQECFKDKSPGDEVSCPTCRKEFQVPANGLDGLQHNFFVQQLADLQIGTQIVKYPKCFSVRVCPFVTLLQEAVRTDNPPVNFGASATFQRPLSSEKAENRIKIDT